MKDQGAMPAYLDWRPIENPPRKAGRYLVARDSEVREARWQPTKRKWTFPSAQSAFVPTHWTPLPEPPPLSDQPTRQEDAQ